jgi:hypothetical protein
MWESPITYWRFVPFRFDSLQDKHHPSVVVRDPTPNTPTYKGTHESLHQLRNQGGKVPLLTGDSPFPGATYCKTNTIRQSSHTLLHPDNLHTHAPTSRSNDRRIRGESPITYWRFAPSRFTSLEDKHHRSVVAHVSAYNTTTNTCTTPK